MRLLKPVGGGLSRRSVIHIRVSRIALGCIPQRSARNQSARIHRPKRNPGPNRRVDGRVQLRNIVHAVQPQSAGEINERFLFAHLLQHPGRGLQSGELPVGVEDVELAVVLPERCAGVGAAGVIDGIGRPLTFAHNQRFKNAQQPVAVGREILQHVHRSAVESQNRNQVGGGHLLAHKVLGSRKGAHLVLRRHGAHVKVKRQQPVVFVFGAL